MKVCISTHINADVPSLYANFSYVPNPLTFCAEQASSHQHYQMKPRTQSADANRRDQYMNQEQLNLTIIQGLEGRHRWPISLMRDV